VLADSVVPGVQNNLLYPDDWVQARQVRGYSLATGADYDTGSSTTSKRPTALTAAF